LGDDLSIHADQEEEKGGEERSSPTLSPAEGKGGGGENQKETFFYCHRRRAWERRWEGKGRYAVTISPIFSGKGEKGGKEGKKESDSRRKRGFLISHLLTFVRCTCHSHSKDKKGEEVEDSLFLVSLRKRGKEVTVGGVCITENSFSPLKKKEGIKTDFPPLLLMGGRGDRNQMKGVPTTKKKKRKKKKKKGKRGTLGGTDHCQILLRSQSKKHSRPRVIVLGGGKKKGREGLSWEKGKKHASLVSIRSFSNERQSGREPRLFAIRPGGKERGRKE